MTAFYRACQWLQESLIPLLLGLFLVVWVITAANYTESHVDGILAQWAAKPASGSPVVLVLIDDATVARLAPTLGPMPWPRTAYVQLFRKIQSHHPAVIAFDGYFPPTGGGGKTLDTTAFEAMKSIPGLIVGIANNNEGVGTFLNPENPAYYQLNLGLVNAQSDTNGMVYGIRPVDKAAYFGEFSGTIPSLSVAAVMEYQSHRFADSAWTPDLSTPGVFRIADGATAPDLHVPLASDGAMHLNWYKLLPDDGTGIRKSHDSIPAWELFAQDKPSAALDGMLKDKIVLVGSSAGMFRDYHPTPMAARHLGTDIQATAIDNLLTSTAMRRAPAWLFALLPWIMCGLIMALRLKVRHPGRGVLYAAAVIGVYMQLAFTLFERMHWIIPIATPVLMMVLGLLFAGMLGLGLREQQMAMLEKNLSQLVSASVLSEIKRRRHTIEPGGQRMEITSMFVDIRNFTAQAEQLSSLELSDMLNAFYTHVVDIVFKYNGTVDKFMGDGILVMFGAPIPDPEHRQKAMACAQEILKIVKQEIGISLHSGMAFVGFLGPRHKLEYTAVGDTVNLCVRLQDYTKQFDTRLIVSAATAETLAEKAQLKPLGTVTVRGREASIAIFTLPQ